MLSDLRFALRQLRKTPGMAALAVLTLALGVGANMAIFTVIESVLLRPLPYPSSDRLLLVGRASPEGRSESWLDYQDIRTQSKLLRASGAYSEDIGVINTRDGAKSVVAPHLTPGLFPLLGAHPMLGRTFSDAEGRQGGPNVVLLAEQLWRASFQADANIVGQVVKIGGIPHTVVGVMPKSFRFPESIGTDLQNGVWLPLQPTTEMLTARGYHFIYVVGQLRPEVTQAQLRSELNAIAARIPRTAGSDRIAFEAKPYQEVLTGPVKPVLYGLLGALSLVLLIACANVSNLLIARCLVRRQEYAVRMALGAGRSRLIRQMLTEGLVLSVIGCALGLALDFAAMEALHKLPDDTIPRADAIGIQWEILLVLIAVAMAATILSSLLPALLAAGSNPQEALQSASRGLGSRSVNARLSGWLVSGEVALSALLLVCAGLLFHTLWNLERAHLGFETARVTSFTAMPGDAAGFTGLSVTAGNQAAAASVAKAVYEPALEKIRATPGVDSAALATAPPFSGIDFHATPQILGESRHVRASARLTAVSGDYARTLRTPLWRGRMIADTDAASAPYVAVVNQAFVREYLPQKDPLNRQLDLGGKDTGMIKPYTIVGVLSDQVDDRVGAPPQPLILLPAEQIPTQSLFYPALLQTMVTFIVRTHGDASVAPEMRAIFQQMTPDYALDNFQTMQEAVDKNTFNQRLGLYLVSSFAALAVVMVIAGLYGVLSQLVSYRQREIGIRMAVGATRESVARLVVGQGSVLIAAGLAAGLLLSAGLGRLVSGFLYHVAPLDGWTYLGTAILLSLIGCLAALLPARRAASLEPLTALRDD